MKLTKKVLSVLIAVGSVWGLASCGEDRTYEYEEKTSEARWVETAVQEWYLWADSMPEFGWKDYFAGSESFLKKLTSKIYPADKWSYSEVDSLTKDYHPRGIFDHLKSYGLDVSMITDPTGNTSRQFVRVKTVYPDSPAERCGLQRNDFITHINGQKVSSSNMADLKGGLARTLVRTTLNYSLEEQMFFWNEADTLALPASEYVEDKAFPLDSVYDFGGYKAGYLMCNRLVASAYEQGSTAGEYRVALDNAMARMKSESVDALILDLRLCNYGEMAMVRRLATYIVGAQDAPLLHTLWKESKSEMNESITADEQIVSNALSLERVYVITSSYTQGAAEWLVQGLKGVLGEENVLTFGTKTAG
ncbi:MAG: PDZ domain-containing protein, partial [Bacteroidaceae bacterium]|nr:PDZ domain-containing protein [Bacteroidaceae bacterium]